MNILVTGGLGYLGSNAVVELVMQGYEITILGNFIKIVSKM